ncbi:MFS transporter [Streptomyces sp. MJP52]|uniref:MFS transporter n=1 Tax=Streptomyces sp. MJP52 TaxID=2940555 RepID=UPI0024761925|nr:MFS transporter [Streptomyces sp. MJP52]MDH6223901.1 EmrB/QacA subfamily drug resistance transporter [Streptomyces sp. MJP52]
MSPLKPSSHEDTDLSARSARSRPLSLLVLCAGALMTILDGNIVTVAMPAVQRDLGFSAPGLAWVVNAYLIPFGGLLLLAGRLGDLLGRKRMFTSGLAVFTVASVLCGVAGGPALLVAARALQGVGGAMTTAVVLGMIVALYPEPREQARAIAVFSAVGAAGAALGTFLGGALTQAAGWHWIFLINLPVGAVAWFAAVRVLPADRPAAPVRSADWAGAVLVTGALMTGVYAIIGSGGRTPGATLVLAAVAVALLGGFALRQSRAAHPLLRLGVLRSRTLSGANGTQVLMLGTMYGFQYIGTLYLQRVLGHDELSTSFAFLPAPLLIGALTLGLAARLVGRFGPYRVLLAGLALATAGMALLGRAPADGSYAADVLTPLLMLSAGFAVAMPALTGLAMAGVAEEDAGLASGLFNTTQVVGGSLGLAVLTTLAAGRTQGLLGEGVPLVAATADGYRLAFAVAAGLGAAALALAAATLRPGRADG